MRGVVGFAGVSCYYWAVQLLPMTDVAALSFLAPVLVAAAAPLVLGERAGRGVLLALPLRVVGVVLVAQPTFLVGTSAAAVSMLGVAVGIAQASKGMRGCRLPVASVSGRVPLLLACRLLACRLAHPIKLSARNMHPSAPAAGCRQRGRQAVRAQPAHRGGLQRCFFNGASQHCGQRGAVRAAAGPLCGAALCGHLGAAAGGGAAGLRRPVLGHAVAEAEQSHARSCDELLCRWEQLCVASLQRLDFHIPTPAINSPLSRCPSLSAVVWGLLADLALFHHKPSPVSLLGAALVCLSSLIIVVAEQRSSSSSVGSGSGSAAAAAAAESKQGVGTASNADGDKMLELAADGGSRQFDGKDGLAAADNAEERAPLAASAQRQPGGAM